MADLLGGLVQTIETLQKRIKEHGSHIGAYESRTRVTLINPMLSALGWDVDDPSAVEIEPKTDEGWADYALLGSNGKPVIFVEAKKLTENVKSHTKQSVNYAVGENLNRSPKIQYCALTNGDVWQVYDVLSQDLILEISISSPDSAKSALKFLGLWRRSLHDGGFDQAVEPLVEVRIEAAPESIAQIQEVSGTATHVPARIEISEAGWVPLNGDYLTTGYPPPNALKLSSDEEPKDIKSWASVPMEVALWLHKKSLLTRENCRFSVTQKRHLFSPDGKHATGTAFHAPRSVGNTGIRMEASFNPDKLVTYTCALLQHFGQDPSQVYLKLS